MLRERFISGFTDELKKIARVTTALQPYQQRVVDRIQRPDQPGLVVAHGLGSGKTLTSIAAQQALGTEGTAVVPASLQANYAKEIGKHTKGKKNKKTKIVSMQKAVRDQGVPDTPFLAVDEAHRLRESGSKSYQTLKRVKADKRLLLTGSPFYNRPSDIAPLVNIAAGENVLPVDQQEFEKQYITNKKVSPGLWGRMKGVKPGIVPSVNPQREQELRNTFSKWVDYYPGSQKDFPTVTREDVNVPMSRHQLAMYDTMLKKAPPWVAYKIRHGMPTSKQESQQLNAFLSGVRQVSGSTAPFQTKGTPSEPKIQAAYDRLKTHLDQDPTHKAVVYSNYLQAGLDPYKRRLEAGGIPYGEFTGQMNKKKRNELVQQYNEGKLRTLLLSSAGGEGLDLKGTRLMQILEPHWNEAKLDQVEGRGARYMSHSHLTPEQQKLQVQSFYATRPRSGMMERMHLKKPGGGVDEYLAQLSADKAKLIDQFRGLLSQPQQVPA